MFIGPRGTPMVPTGSRKASRGNEAGSHVARMAPIDEPGGSTLSLSDCLLAFFGGIWALRGTPRGLMGTDGNPSQQEIRVVGIQELIENHSTLLEPIGTQWKLNGYP